MDAWVWFPIIGSILFWIIAFTMTDENYDTIGSSALFATFMVVFFWSIALVAWGITVWTGVI